MKNHHQTLKYRTFDFSNNLVFIEDSNLLGFFFFFAVWDETQKSICRVGFWGEKKTTTVVVFFFCIFFFFEFFWVRNQKTLKVDHGVSNSCFSCFWDGFCIFYFFTCWLTTIKRLLVFSTSLKYYWIIYLTKIIQIFIYYVIIMTTTLLKKKIASTIIIVTLIGNFIDSN